MPKTKPRQGVEFLIPLATRRAATEDEGGGDWVKVLPIGSWASHHFWPTEGIYEITAENLAAMEANFRADIPPIKIAVNQNHSRGPSVGWIEDLKAEADGLRARVKWTPLGDELLTQDAFRYVSAEWYDSATPYIEKTSGRKIAWVFEGLAVTNNPFFVELPGLQPAAAEEDGTLVYTGPAAAPDKGEDAMPKLQDAPPQPKEGSDPGRTPEDVEALRAERDRLAADKAVLEAQAAERKAAEQLEKLTARFAAVKTKDGQLAEAHAKRLATVAIEVPEDKREEHVTATIEALSTGIVPAGEIGGMGAQITSDGISPALVATARRLGLDPAFVYAAANRGPGGALDIEGARAGVGRISPLAASVEVPSLSYQETMLLIEGFFVAGYESTPALTTQFANRVTSNQRTIDYSALGAPPRMREWLDEIQGAVLNTLAEFPVTVRDWEATVEIRVSELQADKLGQYAMRIQQMGAFAKQHPDELLAALIAAAETTLCYDGQYLCDIDHSEGSSGTQSNFLTTGYDDDDIADISLSLGAAVAAFHRFKDDRGKYLRIGSRPNAVYDVICRPEVLNLFDQIATSQRISGSDNSWKGRIRPMALPELTVASDFYVAYTEGPVKPFIVQYQKEPSALKSLGPDSEHAKKTGRSWFSTQGNYTVAPGDWRYLIKLQKA